MLAKQNNLVRAAELILGMGPDVVIVKKGESGSLMQSKKNERFILPAFPTSEVKDPTGAGDSFAGALMGRLAQLNRSDFNSLKEAVAYGTVVASYAISDFSLAGLKAVTRDDIDKRFDELKKLTQF